MVGLGRQPQREGGIKGGSEVNVKIPKRNRAIIMSMTCQRKKKSRSRGRTEFGLVFELNRVEDEDIKWAVKKLKLRVKVRIELQIWGDMNEDERQSETVMELPKDRL